MPDSAFKVGLLSHVRGSGKPAAQVYAELLDTIAAAEELGFDGVFLAQRHFGHDDAGLPSPLVLLAAAARRTSRIELGTAVSTIALEDPLRFAEDAAVLDALSGGRLQLGLGTGAADATATAAFGVDPEQLDERYDAALAIVHGAVEGKPVRGTEMVLHPPTGDLRGRIWQSARTVERAERVARAGDGLFIDTSDHEPLPLIDAYRTAWSGPGRPRIGAIVADPSSGPARPDEVVESLRRDPTLLEHVDYVIVVHEEASSAAEGMRRLEVTATRIALELGWRPTP
jgi:alkanesulfonate monooxygenase SsuD/methylene tetrahydromethanopterin reductase-like flavin-dependent oxidoreductase (luciferase family)